MKINKKTKIILSITTILLVVLSIMLVININTLNILSDRYMIILVAILIILDTLLIFNLARKKDNKKLQIINIIICILVAILMIIGIIYTKNTIDFMKNITNNEYNSDKKKYSIIVLNDNYNSINDLENKNIGFIKTDTLYKENLIEFNKITKLKFNENKFDEFDLIISSLEEGTIDAISFDDAHMNLLQMNYADTFKKIKIIYTYYVSNTETKEENLNLKPFIVYISGIDTYGNVSNVSRSDVNIIAVVNIKESKILLLNTPRDYYVQLHNTTGLKDKLTHSGIYGIEMSEKTLEDLYNIKIDYYVRLNFTSFINIMDEMGDISVYSDTTFKTSNKPHCDIKEGMNTLNSACALAYSRERYAYKTGDNHRGENQQEVIKGVVNKLTNTETLLKYNKILSKLDGTLQTNMSYETITELIKYEIETKKSFEVETISVVGSSAMEPTYSIRSQKLYVTIPNDESVKRASNKIYEYLK